MPRANPWQHATGKRPRVREERTFTDGATGFSVTLCFEALDEPAVGQAADLFLEHQARYLAKRKTAPSCSPSPPRRADRPALRIPAPAHRHVPGDGAAGAGPGPVAGGRGPGERLLVVWGGVGASGPLGAGLPVGGDPRQHGGGTRPKPAGGGVAPYYRRLHGALKHHHEHLELSVNNNHLLVSINDRLEPGGGDPG